METSMSTSASLEGVKQRLAGMLVEDTDRHVYRLHRQRLHRRGLFDLEMKAHLPKATDLPGHESQIANPTTTSPRRSAASPSSSTPQQGRRAQRIINACSHRGAPLWPPQEGQQDQLHLPPWLDLQNSGKLLKVKDANGAGYPDNFNKDGSHDLRRWRASRATWLPVRQA